MKIIEVDWSDSEVVKNISCLLNKSFATYKSINFNEEFLRWKHFHNPYGSSISLLALDEVTGEFLGFRSFISWKFVSISGEIIHAYQPVDTATSPEARGKGVFSALTKKAVELTNKKLIFNTPNENSLSGYLKLGWLYIRSINFKFIPIFYKFTGLDFSIHEIKDVNYDDFEFSTKITNSSECLRTYYDPDIFKWRFIDIPIYSYRFVNYKSSFIIYRVNKRLKINEVIISLFDGDSEDVKSSVQMILLKERSLYAVLEDTYFHSEIGFRIPGKSMNLVASKERNLDLSLSDLEVF